MLNAIFGKKEPPEDAVKRWKNTCRSEERRVQREIDGIDRQETKVKNEIKKLAKEGRKDACKILAKEIVQTRRAKERMYKSKATLSSLAMQLQSQLSTIKMAGLIAKSTEVMTAMNEMMKVPEMAETMRGMAKEMMKAGMIEELMTEAIEMAEPADMDELADAEADKIIAEIMKGTLAQAAAPPSHALPAAAAASSSAQPQEEDESDAQLQSRLAALRA